MSLPSSESSDLPTVLTKKSSWNAYNAMLACALGAQLIAFTLLLLELFRYGWQLKGPSN